MIVAIIPARYTSSRFPGKPLANICGKPMIQWVYESSKKVPELSAVYVATDDNRIYDAVISFGGQALMTSENHSSGTDRVAECAEILGLADDDVVINVQGDEPLISPNSIRSLVNLFKGPNVYMGTLVKAIDNEEDLQNPNVVKAIFDKNNNAIYFSRYCVPYVRDNSISDSVIHYKHIGMYGYRKSFLVQLSRLPKSSLECAESLEQLRIIENGFTIKVAKTDFQTIGVDTPEQLAEVEKIIRGETNV